MALVNPNIAMSFRAPEIPQQNALADYAAIQQIQGGRQAQELNALKIQEYERSRAEEEGLRNYLAQADLAKPETRSGLLRYGKTGLAYGKALGEQETAALTKQKTGLEVKEKEFDLKRKKLESSVRDFTNFNTVSDVLGHIQRQLAAGEIDQQQAQQLASQVPQTDAELPAFQIAMLRRTLGAKDQLEQTKVTTKDTDRGGYVERQTYDSQGKPVGAPVKLPKTATIGETTAQGQLTLAKNKFAWEQQNPGFELQESQDGTIMAINKRTLQAVPVTVGGAAPAAVPAVGGAGVPATGARVPAAAAQATPAPMAGGTPLRGKGQAMTETQSNAAMFGGAMKQAENTINRLESTGTVKNAVVPGLLTGLVNMAPFGSGQGVSEAITSTFNADPTGLIGPNAAQQQLAQAQLAFATAYLRKTSGAAFGASEIANTIKEYFPLQGEGDAIIKQKAAARKRAVEGMRISTNAEGKKYIDTFGGDTTPAAGVDASNPLLRP